MKSMGKMGSSSSSNTKTATKIGVKSDEKSVRILCVGDSLTEGYYQGGRHFSPYTDTLEKLLKNEYSETKWEVVNYGISGFEGGMMKDLYDLKIEEAWKAGKTFDIVIVLGGINDIGGGKKPKHVLENPHGIRALVKSALKDNALVFILTVAEYAEEMRQRGKVRKDRMELNEGLKSLAAEHKNSVLLDFANEFPYFALSETKKEELWDDGLHYKPAGYERMGEIVFEALQSELHRILPPKNDEKKQE
eukprot:CAMPEP_0197517066 /NCGR_PEP_ID=MMETSP1318-20131121/2023_1 /TAXON_ID=552666 /ORGANISM="Partenskyella glossopodia, Strain RCC365" /LENGTH=247 /DNA_ID=CAMNT_0043066307 /DNA_START=173 /DNA_END=916 /DNA_ORIENTATION=-